MKITIKNLDNSKLDFGLRHEYVPTTTLNKNLSEKEKIVVDCEYLRVGERNSYVTMNSDEEMTMGLYRKVFAKKVKGIRNLVINDKPVTTAEELLNYPSIIELDAIVLNVALHILNSDDLNKDEIKNL